jgi:hypothetical protein
MSETQNPGSALGEAIGASMEAALERFLEPLVAEHQARLMTKGPRNQKGSLTKLLMYDETGTAYNIDGVILNEANQPLVLLESKYIRYTKHNRDKGSWICHAHGQVRRRYTSVRSSIAVLAGSWSKTSLAMLTSNNINIFLVPFQRIVAILAERNVAFDWGEKERHLAVIAWEKYSALSESEKLNIGIEMVDEIKAPLETLVSKLLSDEVPREIKSVAIEIFSNLGEFKRFVFAAREDALAFLDDFTLEEILDHSSSFTIFDVPSMLLDDPEP